MSHQAPLSSTCFDSQGPEYHRAPYLWTLCCMSSCFRIYMVRSELRLACPTDSGRWDPGACSSQFPRAIALVIPGRAQLHRRSTDDVTAGGGGVGDAMKSMFSGALSRKSPDVDAPFTSPSNDDRAACREEVCQTACIENQIRKATLAHARSPKCQ